MSFATTRIPLKGIMLSERQRKTNTLFHSSVESKKHQMDKETNKKQNQTNKYENTLMVARWGDEQNG